MDMNWCAVYVSGDCADDIKVAGYPATYIEKSNLTKIELAARNIYAAKDYVKLFIGIEPLFAEVIAWPTIM